MGLVARAFGARRIHIPGADIKIKRNIDEVTARFGGDFEVEVEENSKEILGEYAGTVVHLTMYGIPLDDAISRIREQRPDDLLIVIGASKVPGYVYEMADLNVSVGNQPHSEIAALSVFLDRLSDGRWNDKDFHGRITVIPDEAGKNVIEVGKK